MWKNGKSEVRFEHALTSHKVMMRRWRCPNIKCNWTNGVKIKNELSGNMHLDLMKLQAEYGSNNSYRKSKKQLSSFSGKRTINNHMRIRKTTNVVGNILSDNNKSELTKKETNSADKLCVVVDGGHVHDATNKGKNFEAMMGKVFHLNDVVRIDKYHTKIVKKQCAGSSQDDKQKTMKANIVTAAKKSGICKNTTEVTSLADGAKNCWNIINSLNSLCLTMLCILDWFHIGKYIQRVKASVPYLEIQLNEIKEMLWHGRTEEALIEIRALLKLTTNEKHTEVMEKLYGYISDNKNYIINYNVRKNENLPYTSHVAESTVEHLLNERCKRKQKMQWSRDGLHSVIQIRASQASNDWDNDWENIITPNLKKTA